MGEAGKFGGCDEEPEGVADVELFEGLEARGECSVYGGHLFFLWGLRGALRPWEYIKSER